MTSFAYTDEQQIDELLNEIAADFDDLDDNETDDIMGDLDDLLADILGESWYIVPVGELSTISPTAPQLVQY